MPETLTEMRPFVIRHERVGETPGRFTPAARLIVTPALRTSGLMAALPDAEFRTLILLLTFLSPNGHIQATAPELAAGLQASEGEMRRRLQRLMEQRWQGEPLASVQTAESGLERFSSSPGLLSTETALPAPVTPDAPRYFAAGREAVLAQSRSHYARSRAEVESEIAAFLGHDQEEAEDTPQGDARRKLSALGVTREQIALLLAEHSLDEISNQIAWLPQRGAKSPARFIVAAIQNSYAPPAGAIPEPPLDATPPNEQRVLPDEGMLPNVEVSLVIPSAAKEANV